MCKGHGHFVKKYLLKNFVNTFFKYSLLKVRPFGSYNFIALFTCLKKKSSKYKTQDLFDNNTDHLKRYP